MSTDELYPPQDVHQSRYREIFGIVDKYLVCYENDDDDDDIEKAKKSSKFRMIVYIDAENDVDWIVKGDNKYITSQEAERKKTDCLCKLDIAQAQACPNLSDKNIMRFKIILGAGYNAALHGDFDSVDMAIQQASEFVMARNKEQARYLILKSATICVLLALIIGFVLWFFIKDFSYDNLLLCTLMGIVGSYVSIWSRSSNLDYSGVSTKALHHLEAIARMLCGGIFGSVAFIAIRAGILFSGTCDEYSYYVYPLLGFVSGFNERFIPSVLERISSQH